MTWKNTCTLIAEDVNRLRDVDGSLHLNNFMNASFLLTFHYRIGHYLRSKRGLFRIVFVVYAFFYKFVKLSTGIQMPLPTVAGGGLRFLHHDCIVIAGSVKMGSNVSIGPGVTIGRSFGGKKSGVPEIGNNVVIFAGAKIIGNIKVGNHAVIGVNSVVISDVPPYAVVCGAPARVISENSAHCFNGEWSKAFCQDE
jgi:serine O-acetyltransferase